MKKKISRDMVLFLIFIPIFLTGAFYISSRADNNFPAYTIDNKGRDGYSVFYETLKALKVPVERTLKPIKKQNIRYVQIVPSGGNFNLNSVEVISWVKEGGNLVYFTYSSILPLENLEKPQFKGSLSIYGLGKGSIIVEDSSSLTNSTLIKDKAKAYELYSELAAMGRPVYFNETYMYSQKNNLTFWDYIPMEVKFIIYQLLIVLVAFFYYKGRRFGKAVPLYEEVERSENEYIYSAASLYRIGKCSDLMVENYYNSLLRELKCSSEEFLDTWQRESLPSFDKARKVYDFVSTGNYKNRSKEHIHIISVIEQLRKIVRKRRESYWKTLKKV